jgi:DNA-directed RNA polymerase specialized sigma24 family protein
MKRLEMGTLSPILLMKSVSIWDRLAMYLSTDDKAALAERARQGDLAAWAQLQQAHDPDLRAWLAVEKGVVRDDTQAVAGQIWKIAAQRMALPGRDPGAFDPSAASFFAWLKRIEPSSIIARLWNDIVDKARLGDPDAFKKLLAAHARQLRSYLIFRRIPSFDRSEVAQKIWVKAAEMIRLPLAHRSAFDPKQASFITWLKRFIAPDIIRDYWIAWKKRNAQVSISDSTIDPPEPTDGKESGAEWRLTGVELLFRLLWLCGGFPHKQLAYAMSYLILGRTSGKPSQVAEEYGRKPLSQLLDTFWAQYRDKTGIDDAAMLTRLESYLHPVRCRLNLTVQRMFAAYPSRSYRDDLIQRVGNKTIGATCLADYVRGGIPSGGAEATTFAAELLSPEVAFWTSDVDKRFQHHFKKLTLAHMDNKHHLSPQNQKDLNEMAAPIRRSCPLNPFEPCSSEPNCPWLMP